MTNIVETTAKTMIADFDKSIRLSKIVSKDGKTLELTFDNILEYS